MEAVEIEDYLQDVQVAGTLSKEEGGIVFQPEGLVLVLQVEGDFPMDEEIAFLKLEDLKEYFPDQDPVAYFQENNFHTTPISINEHHFFTPEEAFLTDWYLRNDWDGIPSPAAFKELSQNGQVKPLLQQLYQP